MQRVRSSIIDRILPLVLFIIPVMEISNHFALMFCMQARPLAIFYRVFLLKPLTFYQSNFYLIFGIMITFYYICIRSKDRPPLFGIRFSSYTKYNVLQAALSYIVMTSVGALFNLLPAAMQRSAFGGAIGNFAIILGGGLCLYSMLIIIGGGYPRLPLVSEAARLQMQQNR